MKPAYKLLDTALTHAPDAELAAAVRALADDDLARAVREVDGLRRFVLMAMLADLGGAPKKNGRAKPNGKPAPRTTNHVKRRRPDKAIGGLKRDAVAAELAKAGSKGLSRKEITERTGMSFDTVGSALISLKKLGTARLEGTRNSARWYAADA